MFGAIDSAPPRHCSGSPAQSNDVLEGFLNFCAISLRYQARMCRAWRYERFPAIASHMSVLAGADFFTVEVLKWGGPSHLLRTVLPSLGDQAGHECRNHAASRWRRRSLNPIQRSLLPSLLWAFRISRLRTKCTMIPIAAQFPTQMSTRAGLGVWSTLPAATHARKGRNKIPINRTNLAFLFCTSGGWT